jgi:hypothetical protein
LEGVVEITLNDFAIHCLNEVKANHTNFKGIDCLKSFHRLLKTRQNVYDIGNYTAIFLQSRIRKYITKRKVRRDILRRFELIPSNSFRKEFLLDLETNGRLEKYPLIKNERPCSPTTIERRLRADEKRRNKRYNNFNRYMKDHPNDFVLFEDALKHRYSIQQMLVLHDVIYVAMVNLAKVFPHTNSASSSVNPTERTDSTQNDDLQKESLIPVFVTLCNFGQSLRKFSLSIALKRLPRPETVSTQAGSTSMRQKSPDKRGSSPSEYINEFTTNEFPDRATSPPHVDINSSTDISEFFQPNMSSLVYKSSSPNRTNMTRGRTSNTGDGRTTASLSNNQVNKALIRLEQTMMEAIKCDNPDDVLACLLSEEYFESMVHVKSFAKTAKALWNSNLDFVGQSNMAYNSHSSYKTLTIGEGESFDNDLNHSISTKSFNVSGLGMFDSIFLIFI